IGSTVPPVVVFLPLALLTGVTGVFFRSLALTMAVALLTSLVLALSFTPVLAQRFVKVRPRDIRRQRAGEGREPPGVRWVSRREAEMRGGDSEEERETGRLLGAIIRRYEAVLNLALKRNSLVLALAPVVLAGSYFLYRHLGSQ